MRSVLFPLGLSLLLMVSGGLAQTTEVIVEDAAGDVTVGAAVPTDAFPAADLRLLGYAADPDTLWLTLGVTGFDSAERTIIDSTVYVILFDYGGATYAIRMERLLQVSIPPPEPLVEVDLLQLDTASRTTRLVSPLNHTIQSDAVTFEVPLFLLRTSDGVPAHDGAEIANLVVGSAQVSADDMDDDPSQITNENPPTALYYDRMPDAGAAAFALDVPGGGGSQVILESPEPRRASNGGPGTFVFPIRLINVDDQPHDRVLSVRGLPANWDHAFVSNTFHLQPGDDVQTQLVVEASSGHTHGGATNFTVAARDLQGAGAGELKLAVAYTAIAQPAGHHPTLFFHVLAPEQILIPNPVFASEAVIFNRHRNTVVMNTLRDDPEASGLPATENDHTWTILLSPGLGMGLDFDLKRSGQLHATIASSFPQLPLRDFRLDGELLLLHESDRVLLAEIAASDPMDVSGPVEMTLTIEPTPAADLIPYQPGQTLQLVLNANYVEDLSKFLLSTPQANLLSGSITLPLLEYQDPVPAGTERDVVATVSPNPQHGNPGDLLEFQIDVQNAGARPLDLRVDPLTTSPQAVPSVSTLGVGIGSSNSFSLLVDVPVDTTDGDQFTVFVRLADGDVATLTGATVIVTTMEEVESVDRFTSNETSALSWIAILAALGVASLAFRNGRLD